MRVLTSKKGFTMLELLMVIIVIGILASLAIPQYQSFMEKARTAEARNVISSIKSAQELYFLEHGWYGGVDVINNNYVTFPTSGTLTLWTYAITTPASGATNATTYTVRATRTTKDGGVATTTGDFTWNRTTGQSTWTGKLA
ncbi:MAG: type IV pilin protein [Candidatus Omnitrophica bacterium]|jgi:prepilin-type N-terminal cleavage/methylation domain-containing protein|nr:type IV pilin protein [Candidatus Omnitrophota bacterium]